ncbi:MAG TPA: FGGY-family carbohydrate kinase, partial [Sphingomonas sp.]
MGRRHRILARLRRDERPSAQPVERAHRHRVAPRDSGDVMFVPALAGSGAPHWDSEARGIIRGMELATTPAHLTRATLKAVATQIADVMDA